MTMVEFFSQDAVKNWITTWTCAPDKVVLVGDDATTLCEAVERYQVIADAYGRKTHFSHCTIPMDTVDNIVAALERSLHPKDVCTFDLLGGGELYLTAVGVLYQKYPDRVRLHRCDENHIPALCKTVSLQELMRVYGGCILFSEDRANATYRWTMNEEFISDIEAMWALCRKDVSKWNSQVGMLERARTGPVSSDPLQTAVRKSVHGANGSRKYLDIEWLRDLQRIGVIADVHEHTDAVSFRYKNAAIKKSLSKEGQLLELVITAAATQCKDERGERLYHDVLTGAVLDWDGIIDPRATNVDNEIDVLLIHGITPIFVSCKNGDFKTEELFKLYTVARHFGGDEAKKILIAPKLDDLGDRGKSLAARAKALGIRVVETVESMSDEERLQTVASFWKEL